MTSGGRLQIKNMGWYYILMPVLTDCVVSFSLSTPFPCFLSFCAILHDVVFFPFLSRVGGRKRGVICLDDSDRVWAQLLIIIAVVVNNLFKDRHYPLYW